MRNKDRGRLLEVGSYVIAGAIAVGAFGHCLFGACLPGSGAARAAEAAGNTKIEGTAGHAKSSGEQAKKGATSAAPAAPKGGSPAGERAAKTAKVVTKDFEISGMFCSGCADHVSKAVRKLPGVKDVKIDYESGKGHITFEEGIVDAVNLVSAIKKAGYKAKPAS